MKHLRKITLLLVVLTLLFSISCGSDDEVDLSEVEFAFDAENPPVDQTLITNLSSSGDQNGSQIGAYLNQANFMTLYISLFQNVSGAEKSSVPIGTCGGNAAVYTYSYSGNGESFTVSYQICDLGDKYVFQVFFSENGSTPQQFIYAEQSKSANEGYMELYGSAIGVSEVVSTPVIRYTWEETSDGVFNFVVSDSDGGFVIDINVNADNSGELSYTIDGNLSYEATWNSEGTAGSYTYYNTDGTVSSSGDWPA